jgi:pantoate--beta-alanine ligase
MKVTAVKSEVRAWVRETRSSGGVIALVPTMGYLHAGHLSLLEIARRHADHVALSIFVNPLQFGAGEDLERYPRDLQRDLDLASAAGTDLVFAPPVTEMYPTGEPWVSVIPERGADVLCGRSRPGHFRGVLTVVNKLFGIFAPDVAVFGEKDFQQLALIRRMVADLDIPVRIEAGPIVREADGLAMSSRNRYLSEDDRERALSLSRALGRCSELFRSGVHDAAPYRQQLQRAGGAGVSVEYAEVVDPDSLLSIDRVESGSVCLIAARVGGTRLIDNVVLGTPARL